MTIDNRIFVFPGVTFAFIIVARIAAFLAGAGWSADGGTIVLVCALLVGLYASSVAFGEKTDLGHTRIGGKK